MHLMDALASDDALPTRCILRDSNGRYDGYLRRNVCKSFSKSYSMPSKIAPGNGNVDGDDVSSFASSDDFTFKSPVLVSSSSASSRAACTEAVDDVVVLPQQYCVHAATEGGTISPLRLNCTKNKNMVKIEAPNVPYNNALHESLAAKTLRAVIDTSSSSRTLSTPELIITLRIRTMSVKSGMAIFHHFLGVSAAGPTCCSSGMPSSSWSLPPRFILAPLPPSVRCSTRHLRSAINMGPNSNASAISKNWKKSIYSG
mmetsp:Transcript_41416/g.68157  ORF Transcript_41416/g.68157 Transcript_41416/m.68157 type:complete len:257 (+) Transcript_41416:1321-2091(+)